MRKGIVAVIVLALLGSAGAYVYFYQPFARPPALISLLPGDTLAMVRICRLKEQIQRFKTGRMGRSLARVDMPRVLALLQVSERDRTEFMQFSEAFKNALNSAWFDLLFGQEMVVALQGSALHLNAAGQFDRQQWREAVIFVSRPKQPTRVLESLNSMFARQLQVGSESFQQWKINHFALDPGLSIYYALTDGMLVAGLSPKSVQRCLEQSLDETGSLLQAAAYKAHCAGLYKDGQTDLIAFADTRTALDLGRQAVAKAAEKQPDLAALKKQLADLNGLESINVALYDDGGPLVQAATVVGIDRRRMSPIMARAFGSKPETNPTLRRIPMDALVYAWQNTFDLNLYWQQFQHNPAVGLRKIRQIQDAFKRNLGMDVDQFLAAFGTQFGLLVNDIDTGGMFPIPELALFIQAVQPAVVDRTMHRLADQFGTPLQTEDYKGVTIGYTVLPMGASLSPAYACSDGFCTVASSKTLLKAMQDADAKGDLTAHPDFKAVDHGLTDANNQTGYIQMEGLVARSRDITAWAMAWMAMVRQETAERNRQIVDLLINPVLDGLSMIKAVGTRTYIEETRIKSDTYAALDRS